MNSAECRHYAQECRRLAEKSAPEHRDILLNMADKWLQVAAELVAFAEPRDTKHDSTVR